MTSMVTYRTGLLSSVVVVSYIAMTSSMSLDLTELRNKVSNIKVNPRGNLWATGHFMGKKSVVDSFPESPFGDADAPQSVSAVGEAEDWRDLIIQQVLRTALKARQTPLEHEDQMTGLLVKLLLRDNI